MKKLSIDIIKTLTSVKYPRIIDSWNIEYNVCLELMLMNKIEIDRDLILKALTLSNDKLKNQGDRYYVTDIKKTNLQIILDLYPKSIYINDDFIEEIFNYINDYSYVIKFLKEISIVELFFDIKIISKNDHINIINCRSYKIYKLTHNERI